MLSLYGDGPPFCTLRTLPKNCEPWGWNSKPAIPDRRAPIANPEIFDHPPVVRGIYGIPSNTEQTDTSGGTRNADVDITIPKQEIESFLGYLVKFHSHHLLSSNEKQSI